jgi:hypothetical protein
VKSLGALLIGSFSLPFALAFFFAVSASEFVIASEPAAQSLKGKTDNELLRLVIGGRNDEQRKRSEELREGFIQPSSLDPLWEMSPREAALALASECVDKVVRGRVKFTIDNSANAKPPSKGEIGISWISGNYYAPHERGVIALRYDGPNSGICFSDFQILGPVSERELDEALRNMDDHKLPQAVAQQTYEMLWWLRRVHAVGGRFGGTGFSSTDDYGDSFWMKPDGPFFVKVFLGTPDGQDLDNEEFSSLPAFCYTVLRRVMERQGIKPRRPLPTIGQHVDANPDAKFMRSYPRPDSDDADVVKKWVERMLTILRDDERREMHSDVLYALVPTEDPLRYKDPAIDRALLAFLRTGDVVAASHEKAVNEAKHKEQSLGDNPNQPDSREQEEQRRALSSRVVSEQSAGFSSLLNQDHAGEALGFRDNVSAFSELLERAKRPIRNECSSFSANNCLTGAAALAGKHPKLRAKLADYLRPQLTNIRGSKVSASQLFDVVWRADLRELAPALEKVATSSPDDNEDPSVSTSPAPTGGNGKFHGARVILMAWRETDPLTKTKLDAMINGYVGGSNSIPEVLRAEFDTLSSNDQLAFRTFITWLRSVEVPWSRKLLEDIFTSHTPRPSED